LRVPVVPATVLDSTLLQETVMAQVDSTGSQQVIQRQQFAVLMTYTVIFLTIIENKYFLFIKNSRTRREESNALFRTIQS